MLFLTYCALATVEELFQYKSKGFKLSEFPGYTVDQWGIKAHNRPWIEERGQFAKGQKIIEVGGGYSLLCKYLNEKYQVEAWIGDDFGITTGTSEIWSRWANPYEHAAKNPQIKYVFEPFGNFSDKYPDQHFDRIFSVSTLEHIPSEHRLTVFKDMHRCLKTGGMELHTIDISNVGPEKIIMSSIVERIPILNKRCCSEIQYWIEIIKDSGVKIVTKIPSSFQILDRRILVESPDVVYRFYPPNEAPKPYSPNVSLLFVIEDK
ncbi:MAG: hypothetical protein A2Y97_05035 [Nitrospirae bacterium RBG_13_39_12]|nr:MAG: hypothetical protein A2Y97_05035 [Nitrospirae bacterium RBG_13_39_12]